VRQTKKNKHCCGSNVADKDYLETNETNKDW